MRLHKGRLTFNSTPKNKKCFFTATNFQNSGLYCTVSVFDLLARPESDGTDLARHGDECSGAQTERGDGLQQTGHQR